jgi:hypothetical protein
MIDFRTMPRRPDVCGSAKWELSRPRQFRPLGNRDSPSPKRRTDLGRHLSGKGIVGVDLGNISFGLSPGGNKQYL